MHVCLVLVCRLLPGVSGLRAIFIQCVLVFTQEKERKARRRGKALQNEEASAPYTAEEEEMEGSGASGNEEEAAEDGEGTSLTRAAYITLVTLTKHCINQSVTCVCRF